MIVVCDIEKCGGGNIFFGQLFVQIVVEVDGVVVVCIDVGYWYVYWCEVVEYEDIVVVVWDQVFQWCWQVSWFCLGCVQCEVVVWGIVGGFVVLY